MVKYSNVWEYHTFGYFYFRVGKEKSIFTFTTPIWKKKKKIDGKGNENNWLKLGLGDSLWFHFIFLYPTSLSKP